MSTVSKIPGYTNKTFVLCMKGIENSTGKRLSEVLIESGVNPNNIAVWVGPGHIQEFTRMVPNCMIIDSYNSELAQRLVEQFSSNLIRFYIGNDIIGSEIGAAAKNVMGIRAGMLDGLGYSVLKGALMARGAHEVAQLIKAKGGNELSAYGLCHLGDYEATLFSQHSHNRKFGEMFVKNEPFTKLAEGVATTSAMLKMAEELKVELPITQSIYNILNNLSTPQQILDQLFSRENKKEF
jgi:glycerol-3-phosphate dehydrogenase (NAD(P)+)